MKVLIVGLGAIAQKHLNALKRIAPDAAIYALRSKANSAAINNITNIYSLDEIKDLHIDFAIVSNPTANHQQAIEDLSVFGMPLFIEKPIFSDLNFGSVEKVIAEENIITYVACNLRFLGCINFVKGFIADKRINEVNSYCGSYLPDWRPNRNFREIYSANKEMGGGVHLDLVHEMDYIYWLLGQPVNIHAVKKNNSSLNISAFDYANYLLEYDEFCANITLNYYRRDAKRSLEVITDEGTIGVNLLTNTVSLNEQVIYHSDKTVLDTYDDQLRFFIDKVLGERVAFNTISEAINILELCLTGE